MNLTNKVALVTGATAGIGEAVARGLAAAGCSLILTGRRTERLASLKAEMERKYGVEVTTLGFDITQRNACEQAFSSLKPLVSRVEILINNAGLAIGVEKMQDANIDDWETMIDTNIKGLLYMTRLVLPEMIQRGSGHIVNLGSVAGRWVYPGGGVYCASKFAVRALSEGLRMDLAGTGLRVTNIEPGMVETEFSEVRLGDVDRAKAVYAGMEPLSAADIAETVVWCVSRPNHVNIQELVIFPTDQAAIGQIYRSKEKRP